jgi:hypothetical protein
VTSGLHVLSSVEQPLQLYEQEAEWLSELVWMQCRRVTCRSDKQELNPGHSTQPFDVAPCSVKGTSRDEQLAGTYSCGCLL